MTDVALALPAELERATEKFDLQQDRLARREGYGATEYGLGIVAECMERLTNGLTCALISEPDQDTSPKFLSKMRQLSDTNPAVLSLCVLQSAINAVATKMDYTEACVSIGEAIAGECWAAGLTEKTGHTKIDRARKKLAESIEKTVREKYGRAKRRLQVARTLAAQNNYNVRDWHRTLKAKAGGWAIDVLMTYLPDVFEYEKETRYTEKGEPYEHVCLLISETSSAHSKAENMIAHAVLSNPVWFPLTGAPRPWTGWNKGGTWDARLAPSLSLLRTRWKQTGAAVRNAIHDGTMQPTLDALNTLQSVPFSINQRVLGVIRACAENNIDVPGLPAFTDLTLPAKPDDYDDLSKKEQGAWRYEYAQTARANRGFIGDRVLYQADMQTAAMLAEHDRFYTPMNLDWRGRVYGVPSFNFQREDRVRSLFLFADGAPIGDEGLYWLKVHVANCGDFNKVSKRPFKERVQWVHDNLEQITNYAELPLKELWWTKADKPFLFLAACMELISAMTAGSSYMTSLPISFDGSCSGLQHLCAMTRAPEGSLVNLTTQELPQDVYQVVADRVKERIERDLTDDDRRQIAAICLEFGITRKLVKRNVMTYSYSSKVYGMAEQQREDTMRPLDLDMIKGKLKEHPFGPDKGYAASKYLAQHVYSAIEEVVHHPAMAMSFLQKLAKATAHESKPLRWTTPTGLPWINRYHPQTHERVRMYLHDRGVRLPIHIKLATGSEREINKDKAAQGVAPNFVHALDAAHLFTVANASAREGIRSIATVHDSFGCLAPQATRFREIIREQFVLMYTEHDVLQEVYEQAREDLSDPDCERMPAGVPPKGNLNIEEVLNAEFSFA